MIIEDTAKISITEDSQEGLMVSADYKISITKHKHACII